MFFVLFPAVIILADQLFKYWVTTKLAEGGTIVLIKGFISLIYVENTGAAFGIFKNMRWMLVVFAVIGILAVIYILLTHRGSFMSKVGLAAVLGGAVGNLLDRLVLGYVVDMFSFDFTSFAIFNIADIFITVGGILFIAGYIIPAVKQPKKGTPPAKRAPVKEAPVRRMPEQQTQRLPEIPVQRMPVIKPAPAKEEKPEDFFFEAAEEEAPRYSETAILEEYDLERLLAEYRSEYDND